MQLSPHCHVLHHYIRGIETPSKQHGTQTLIVLYESIGVVC